MGERANHVREMITDIESWNPFCHGTSSSFAQFIDEMGLRPRECTSDGEPVCRPSVWEGKLESKPDRVYLGRADLTLGTCLHSSSKTKEKFGGESIVYGINLDRGYEDKLDSDEDADYFIDAGDSQRRCELTFKELCRVIKISFKDKSAWDEMFPDEVTKFIRKSIKEEGCFTDDEISTVCKDLPRWAYSLISRWTVAYKGVIPPEDLSHPVLSKKLYLNVPGSKEERKKLRRRR